MSHGPEGLYTSDEERTAALETDRRIAAEPLPYADVKHYAHEYQRQTDLEAAERSNIAKAAGELGLTSDEWLAKRAQLGRSPTSRDV